MAPTTKCNVTKRTSLPIKTKVEILDQVDRNVKSKTDIAKQFNLSASSLSTILKNRGKIRKQNDMGCSRKRMRTREAKWPALEKALVDWLKKMRNNHVPVDGKLLKAKADTFALQMGIENIQLSDGWLSRFKKRNYLSFRKMCGESASADLNQCESWKAERLKSLLSEYSPEDVYNADETGLMFKLLPDRSLVFSSEKNFGRKKPKERLTVLLAANMTGSDKLPPLVVGKSTKPRCFKELKSLPVGYKSSKNAWMTSDIFEAWLKELDRRMVLKNRKIVLVIDNCTAHQANNDLKAIRLEFLPPNVTSILQPLDQGIILCFKKNYRRMLLNRIVLCLENDRKYDVSLITALHLLKAAWDSVSSETIRNCFRHAGFAADLSPKADEVPSSSGPGDDELVKRWQAKNAVLENLSFEEYATFDNEIPCVADETDEDIVQKALNSCEPKDDISSDDEVEDAQRRSSVKDAMEAISVLRCFFERQENALNLLDKVMDLENGVLIFGKQKQSLITEFFKA